MLLDLISDGFAHSFWIFSKDIENFCIDGLRQFCRMLTCALKLPWMKWFGEYSRVWINLQIHWWHIMVGRDGLHYRLNKCISTGKNPAIRNHFPLHYWKCVSACLLITVCGDTVLNHPTWYVLESLLSSSPSMDSISHLIRENKNKSYDLGLIH